MTDEHNELYARVGQRVREAREAAKMTQGELGERIGLTRASVTNIETARQNVQLHTLYAIADALQVGVNGLLPPTKEAPLGASPRLQQVLERAKRVRPTDRQTLEKLLSGVSPGSGSFQKPGRSSRTKKSP